jgi:hypothetical protein
MNPAARTLSHLRVFDLTRVHDAADIGLPAKE